MNSGKKSLKTQYADLKSAPTKFREEICRVLGISHETFFIRMRNDSWTDQEKILISNFLELDIEELFPETSESHV